jgi:dipeptidyl aminopeptidase/acylaminoacyl peptidase
MRCLVLSACLAALPCAAQNSTATSPPGLVSIASFAAQDQFYNPRMSPDGKHLAVTVRTPLGKRLVPMITFYSLPGLKLESTVRLKVFEVPADYYWVSNTRLVLEKAQEFGSREAPSLTGEVMAMEFDGTRQEYLYGYDMFTYATRNRHDDDHGYGYVSRVPEPMNNHVMVSSQLWRTERSMLIDIDTRTGTRKERASLSISGLRFVTQADGTPRFAYGSREDNSFVLMRNDGGDSWSTVDKARVGSTLRPLAFTPDNSEVLAWHSARGGPMGLVRENMSSGERRPVAADPNGNLSVMYGSKPGLPIAAITQVGRPHFIYFDDNDPDVKLHKSLSAQFPDGLVYFIDFAQDGSKLMFSVRSDRDPGVYYLYDRRANRADMLMLAMEQIEPEQMAERRPISFKARDGLPLHGYLTMPRHAPNQKVPLVLIPHGGPHGPYDGWYFDSDAQFLASRGYAVLQLNYRGSGGRGPGFEHIGYRQWGGKIMDDLIDGVKWAVAQGEVDGSRMCAFGASFGGYAALMLAAREPDLFKCTIGYAGVYDLPYIYEEDRTRTSRRGKNWVKKFIGEDQEELNRFSPARQAASIKAPVLLIHGGKDEIAPKEHAFRMRDALAAAGKAPEWMYIDYEGHGFYDTENATAVYTKLEDFLKRHIGTK